MQRQYERPALQRFGTFRDLTRAWVLLPGLTEYCEAHPRAEECRTS